MYCIKLSSDLIVEALFSDFARTRKAIDFGIKVKDIIYQASLLNVTAATALTPVQLDFLSIPNCGTLVYCLLTDLRIQNFLVECYAISIDNISSLLPSFGIM